MIRIFISPTVWDMEMVNRLCVDLRHASQYSMVWLEKFSCVAEIRYESSNMIPADNISKGNVNIA